MCRVIPPSITRLHFIHLALFSSDWSHARVGGVITTQIVLHLSIMLATVLYAKPFFTVFETGELHGYRHATDEIPLADINTALPIFRRTGHPPVDGRSSSYDVAKAPGPASRRLRVEHWRLVLRPDHDSTITTTARPRGRQGCSAQAVSRKYREQQARNHADGLFPRRVRRCGELVESEA